MGCRKLRLICLSTMRWHQNYSIKSKCVSTPEQTTFLTKCIWYFHTSLLLLFTFQVPGFVEIYSFEIFLILTAPLLWNNIIKFVISRNQTFLQFVVTVVDQIQCLALCCNVLSPLFFSSNGFYGFYGGILHGRAPIVSTARQIPAMSCHSLILLLHQFLF